MKKTALIAGASGLIGQSLTKQLIADPEYAHIHLLVRRPLSIENSKVTQHIVDYENLDEAPLPQTDTLFCALGTTMKNAGSKEAFLKVDFSYVLALGRKAKAMGIHHFVVVSSMGANPNSIFFYNQVKGKMEEALKGMGLPSLIIMHPSLLVGDRKEPRFLEKFSAAVMSLLRPIIPKSYRSIKADTVASAMIKMTYQAHDDLFILTNDQIEALGKQA